MVSINEATRLIQSNTPKGIPQNISLVAALNHYLADNVIAPIDLPSFRNSAMDGYVVAFKEYEKGTRTFKIKAIIQAGSPIPEDLEEGYAYRIFTGAPVPNNGTLVIMQEKTESNDDFVTILDDQLKTEQNIRQKAEQIPAGEIALPAGHKITPASIGYLSALGITEVKAIKFPETVIISTGNELVLPGNPLLSGQIYESNSSTILSALQDLGGERSRVLQLEDDYTTILKHLDQIINTTPYLILTGGISVGDYDFVGMALKELNVEQLFYKVDQKPGKPMFFGKKGDCLIFALPGNPAAALSCFYTYVAPSIRRFIGSEKPDNSYIQFPLKHEYLTKGTRALILKARLEEEGVCILDGQSSNMMHTFATANALVYLTPKNTAYPVGSLVKTLLI